MDNSPILWLTLIWLCIVWSVRKLFFVVLFLVAFFLMACVLLFVLDKAIRNQSPGTEEVNMLTWPAVGFD